MKGILDNVQHSSIVCGLSKTGLSGRLNTWIRINVQGRTIYVFTEEGDIPLHFVNRSVPQGGVLSLTFFSVSLFGISENLPDTVHISLYADDFCIHRNSKYLRRIRRRLQKAVNVIIKILQNRGLQISPGKSAAVAFTRKNTDRYPILIAGNAVSYGKEHTFMGVTEDRSLTWTPHIRQLKRKLSCLASGTR